jgi:hypothetical protein
MAVQCAIGIASSEQWRQLLSDLINYARPSTRTIQIFARVLQARAPDHPCAGLVDRGVLDAMTIFDAIFIDGIIVAANRFQSDVPTDAALFVLGTETPVESFWRCTTLSWNNVEIGFQAADLTGITESPRSLIKPAILIACTAD